MRMRQRFLAAKRDAHLVRRSARLHGERLDE
jgi:hypothetical protein